jgi:hypothetical protein
MNVKSPSGCIHEVLDDFETIAGFKFYMTKCRHKNYHEREPENYYHQWEETTEPVTCKRCLKDLENLEQENKVREVARFFSELYSKKEEFTLGYTIEEEYEEEELTFFSNKTQWVSNDSNENFIDFMLKVKKIYSNSEM